MILIEIENTEIKTKVGVKNGKPWTMNFQQMTILGHYVDGFASKHPHETTIQLEEVNPQSYPVGKYVVSSESFYFGDFGRFTLGRLKLQPLAQFMAEIEKQLSITISRPQPKAA